MSDNFIIRNKLEEYIVNLAIAGDEPSDEASIQELITWIFEHTKQAYNKNFWLNTIGLTDAEIVELGIIEDIESSINEVVEETTNYIRTRLKPPSSCKKDSFRTKEVNKEGDKVVFCKDKKTNKVVAQSKLIKKHESTELEKVTEQLNRILNEEEIASFKLSNLVYTIEYNSGKKHVGSVADVDTLDYNWYDLGLAQIADIVIKNAEDNGLMFCSEDSCYITYNNNIGSISSEKPITITDKLGNQKGLLTFEMTLWVWTHPQTMPNI